VSAALQKPVHTSLKVTRALTFVPATGTIDEKIYQRQVTKLGLSSSVMVRRSRKGAASSPASV
jgi:hypothetical protein